jgi:acyl carrier protein
VKVNGFRIELGEIEKALMQHESVASAALAVHNNTICAYIVKKQSCVDSSEVVFSSLREMCKAVLTDYMIPKHFMELAALPLSSNGKLQREKLPPPRSTNTGAEGGVGADANRKLVTPSSELEKMVRATFSKVLGIDEATICCRDDTFFSLGGNSITAIRLIFQLRKQVACVLSVQDLFNHPTVLGLTSVIIQAASSPANSGESAQSRIYVIRLKRGDVGKPPIILINPAGASGAWYALFVDCKIAILFVISCGLFMLIFQLLRVRLSH